MHTVTQLRILLSILKQRLIENPIMKEMLLSIFIVFGFSNYLILRKRLAFKVLAKVHRSTRLPFYRTMLEPFIKKELKVIFADQRVAKVSQIALSFGKRILILKAPKRSERGVIYVMFNEIIDELPHVFDMDRLLDSYYLVLEPSWAGYGSEALLQYSKYNDAIFITCPEDEDYKFLLKLNTNLMPLPFGARDWVDPRLCERNADPTLAKTFDIVMNSHWGWRKRHYVLFQTLRQLPELKVALIGVPFDGGTIEEIRNLANYYHVADQITFFERISYDEVMRVNSMAKIGLLLSLKEGGNRAIPECLFCDVPAIVLTDNVGGVRQIINAATGLHVTESRLVDAIKFMLSNLRSYSPRKWALANISCLVTTDRLNRCLREHAVSSGEPWTSDIVPHSNSPEARYHNSGDEENFKTVNLDLQKYFRN